MDELKCALIAHGLVGFTPTFDGKLQDLSNGRWFLGWEVRGFENELLIREARFGHLFEQHKWAEHPDPIDEPTLNMVMASREACSRKTLDHMLTLNSVMAPIEEEVHTLPSIGAFQAPAPRLDSKGKVQLPLQQEIADAVLKGLEGVFIRDAEDPFIWMGTHWQPRSPKNFKRYVADVAQKLRVGECSAGELSSIYELFMNRAPALDDRQTMYQQNPFLANFLDGTLEVVKQGGKYKKTFREHRKADYLTWVLPYHYKAPRPQNRLFEEWIGKAFSSDEDGAGKVRALKQVGGSCLISLFPRIGFLLSDQGGTGKSTFAKLCMRFMGQENYSTVPPHLMEGFLMESMIGKQANIVTDIGKKAVIPEDFMKLVEDGLPILVNRKGRPAIQARIPAIHLFCANALPRGIDGESTAMDRRVTIVEFTKSMLGPDGQSYTRDYDECLMEAGQGAILDFFEDGLDDLLESGGIYFNPDSGKKRLRDWKSAESLTAQFLEALLYGEACLDGHALVQDSEGVIPRAKLSQALQDWSGRTIDSRQVGRMFTELEVRGFTQKVVRGVRMISGVRESNLTERLPGV